MATRIDPSTVGQPTIDLNGANGATKSTNGSGKRPGRSKPDRASRGRPQWVSALLGLIAAGLALAGGWLLLNRETTTDVAPVTQPVLEVARDIPVGTTVDDLIAQGDASLAVRAVPIEFAAPAAISSIEELETLRGQQTLAPIFSGETLTASRFAERTAFEGDAFIDRVTGIEAPEGHLKVSLRLPPSRALAGSLAAGDTVAVLASFNANGDQENITAMLLPAVEVIDVRGDRGLGLEEDAADEPPLPGEEIDNIALTEFDITLAVTPEESTRLAYAVEYGEIMLAVAVEDAEADDVRYADTLETVLGLEDQIELSDLTDSDEPDVADDVEASADGTASADAGDTDVDAADTESGTSEDPQASADTDDVDADDSDTDADPANAGETEPVDGEESDS